MSNEEQHIYNYLKNWPTAFISSQEVSKRVDRKRFQKEGDWARHLLHRMSAEQLLDRDASGGYKIHEEPKERVKVTPTHHD